MAQQRKLVRLQPRQPQKQQEEVFICAGFHFDEHGLTVREEPTIRHWSECLRGLMHIEGSVHFWLGDHLAYGVSRWGEIAVQQMVEVTGYDYKTLDKYRWVAGQIDASRRCRTLSFSHHQAVAALPVDQRELLLTRAEQEAWTSKRVRHEVQSLGCEVKRPAGRALLSGLHHGDCREMLPTLPDESIDLAIIDPPDGPEDVGLLENVIGCVSTKLKPNSHLYMFTTWAIYSECFALIQQYYDLRNCLVWVEQEGPTGAVEAPSEYQILFAHKGRRHLNGGREGDVLYYAPAPAHPVEKPVALLQYLIEKSTQPKEIVLDPFMGTGTTCLAASNVGRGYVGIESERQWYDEAQCRLAPIAGE